MLRETYFNNAGFVLAQSVLAASTTLQSTTGLEASGFLGMQGRFNVLSYARVTISNPEQREAVEIAFILSMNEVDNTVQVIRGQEGTTAFEWDAGSKVDCRVTAGLLDGARANIAFSARTFAATIGFSENFKALNYSLQGKKGFELIPNSWAVGGLPALAQSGGDDAFQKFFSSSVEGVGDSVAVELGVAPDYDSNQAYYPGAIVRNPEAPHQLFAASRSTLLGGPKPALGQGNWTEVEVDADGGIFRIGFLPGMDDPDVWFYPSEIGFICEAHSATSVPTVSAGALTAAGAVISKTNLVNAVALTGIDGSHQRIVLATNIRQGVKGLIFSLDAAATGGSFRGRFYWKGLFVCTNTAAGWPAQYGPPEG